VAAFGWGTTSRSRRCRSGSATDAIPTSRGPRAATSSSYGPTSITTARVPRVAIRTAWSAGDTSPTARPSATSSRSMRRKKVRRTTPSSALMPRATSWWCGETTTTICPPTGSSAPIRCQRRAGLERFRDQHGGSQPVPARRGDGGNG
jgi:hypothetical protein